HEKHLLALLERQPDLQLAELQQRLWESQHTYASLSTISRTLYREGLTNKKVYFDYSGPVEV
ncbi:hypothetical protein BDN72DRAFT_764805, partial [Pluteus cervinus]